MILIIAIAFQTGPSAFCRRIVMDLCTQHLPGRLDLGRVQTMDGDPASVGNYW
jgi:hypothetical protein